MMKEYRMDIRFVSRDDALKMIGHGDFDDDSNLDLISISDNEKEMFDIQAAWSEDHSDIVAGHFVNFLDADDVAGGFTDEKAEAIVKFIAETKERNNMLIVHCWLGVSRSGAVAKWANHYFNDNSDRFLERYSLFNAFVYSKLNEAAFKINLPID